MGIISIAEKLLPQRASASVRHAKKRLEHRRIAALPPLSENDFKEILSKQLGLGEDDIVYVHGSMDGLSLAFPFYRILSLIQEVIGPAGTTLFPTYPNGRISSYEYLQQGKIFDIRRSPSYSGILSEFARRQPHAVRSLQPIKSVCALGPAAEELIATHHLSPYPYDAGSPYRRMIDRGGKVIGLGVSTNYISLGHCVEDELKTDFPVDVYHDRIFAAQCINYEGDKVIVRTYAHNMAHMVHPDMPKFVKTHLSSEACQDLTIRGMKFFRASAREFFDEMMNLARRGVTVYSRSVYKSS